MPRKKTKGLRADGRYQVQLDIPSPDGKRKRKTFYGLSLAEAKNKRDEYIDSLLREPLLDEDVTIDEWAARWLKTYKADVGDRMRREYTSIVNLKILKALGGMKLGEIRPHHVKEMYNEYAGMSQSTIRKLMLTTNCLFEDAAANGLMRINPAKRVKPPKAKESEEQPTIDQKTIKLITLTWDGHPVGIWAMIALYTGTRPEEWARLQKEHIDLKNKAVKVRGAITWDGNKPLESPTKSKAGMRDIPIPKPLRAALERFLSKHGHDVICCSPDGSYLTSSQLYKGWNGYMRYLSAQATRIYKKETTINFIPYALRHTYRTLLFEAGVDELTAARYMGHKNPLEMMKVYTHLREQQRRKSLEKLEFFFE